jgi:hypothetical protein
MVQNYNSPHTSLSPGARLAPQPFFGFAVALNLCIHPIRREAKQNPIIGEDFFVLESS